MIGSPARGCLVENAQGLILNGSEPLAISPSPRKHEPTREVPQEAIAHCAAYGRMDPRLRRDDGLSMDDGHPQSGSEMRKDAPSRPPYLGGVRARPPGRTGRAGGVRRRVVGARRRALRVPQRQPRPAERPARSSPPLRLLSASGRQQNGGHLSPHQRGEREASRGAAWLVVGPRAARGR